MDLPERISLKNLHLGMFFVETAIDIDNHLLAEKGVKVKYSNIFRVGKLIYDSSSDRFETSFFINSIAKYICVEAYSDGFKTVHDFHNILEEVSQDFGAFGRLPRKKQEKLRDLCLDLSKDCSRGYMACHYPSIAW